MNHLLNKGITVSTTNNKELVDKTENELSKIGIKAKFVNKESFKSESDGHIFKKGQIVRLHSLEDYSQFNGEIIVITAIREDGEYGKAYYFSTNNKELEEQLNWTYEYRLEET